MKKIHLGILLLMIFSSPTLAATYYCAAKANYINLGDSTAQVKIACGDPSNIQKKRVRSQTEHNVEQWFYKFDSKAHVDAIPPIVVHFKKGAVDFIDVSGQKLSSSNFCPSEETIGQGDSPDVVRARCGTPSYINQGTTSEPGAIKQIEIWTYKTGEYSSDMVLEFENAHLVKVTN